MRIIEHLALALLLTLGISCERSRSASADLPPCVRLVQDNGARWSLPYADQRCHDPGVELPRRLYDSVASWAFNAQSAGFLPPLEEFRIRARLATLDSRSQHGISFHGGPFLWADYKWAEHLGMAEAILTDALHDSVMMANAVERPLEQLGLSSGRAIYFEPQQRRLSDADLSKLRDLLVRIEIARRDDPRLRLTHRSIEDAVKAVPDYAAERRANFSRYHLE